MILNDITEEEVKNLKSLLEFLKRLSDDGVTPLIEKQIILMLDQSLKFFLHFVKNGIFTDLKRITINRNVIGANKRIREIKHLKYPPKEKVTKFGRCNYPEQSIFYAAMLAFTATNELKPKIGDLITESTWKVRNNLPLLFCPIFKNQPLKENFINPRTFEINQQYQSILKEYPIQLREHIETLTQFIADTFTKNVSPNNDLDYIFSAYFSDKIFNEFENGQIEAIYYPSVQEKLSFENVAIKPDAFDKKYELAEVHDYVIISDPTTGSQGYFSHSLSTCKSFDYASGKILWDPNSIGQPKEILLDLKYRFGVEIEEMN